MYDTSVTIEILANSSLELTARSIHLIMSLFKWQCLRVGQAVKFWFLGLSITSSVIHKGLKWFSSMSQLSL